MVIFFAGISFTRSPSAERWQPSVAIAVATTTTKKKLFVYKIVRCPVSVNALILNVVFNSDTDQVGFFKFDFCCG